MILHSPRRNGKEILTLLDLSSAGEITLLYKIADDQASLAPEPFFIASILPAMTLGGVLETKEPISPKLLGCIPQIQDIFLSWDKHLWAARYPERLRLKRVEVRAPRREIDGAGTASDLGAACFFTAGVDSFYTALKHIDRIEALIYVRGFDVKLSDRETRRTIIRGIRRAAAGLGKPLIEIRSNLLSVCRSRVHWHTYQGSALASAATLFAGRFGRILIPATTTYDNLAPLGSHPLIDPLWSTEEIQIVHDGCEAARIEKLEKIADYPVVQANLRVCLDNPDGAYNCSSCEKCLRTMIQLRAIGRLDRFTCFAPLDPKKMRLEFPPKAPAWEKGWTRTLRILEESDKDRELQEGIKRVLATYGSGTPSAG